MTRLGFKACGIIYMVAYITDTIMQTESDRDYILIAFVCFGFASLMKK